MGPPERRAESSEQIDLCPHTHLLIFIETVPPFPEFIGKLNAPFHITTITREEYAVKRLIGMCE